MKTATLKIVCKDKKGIIALVTNFIADNSGNIIALDEYVDPTEKIFFMMVKWDITNFKIPEDKLREEIKKLCDNNLSEDRWELIFSDRKPRMAIFVSKYDHCLYDLLLRHRSGELKCDIPIIISNHKDLKVVAENFKIEFKHIPVEKGKKSEAEEKQVKTLKKYDIDFIVLARYMQILTKDFIKNYENRIINIHHSFLPAFVGSKAYHQAFQRGVKIIGATAHFVTKDLDCGPIIKQDVGAVYHYDTVEDMIIKGKDIEKKVLSEAIKLYISNRLFVCKNRTIIL